MGGGRRSDLSEVPHQLYRGQSKDYMDESSCWGFNSGVSWMYEYGVGVFLFLPKLYIQQKKVLCTPTTGVAYCCDYSSFR